MLPDANPAEERPTDLKRNAFEKEMREVKAPETAEIEEKKTKLSEGESDRPESPSLVKQAKDKPQCKTQAIPTTNWEAGRKRSVSFNSSMMANLQLESQSKSSWIVSLLTFKDDIGFDTVKNIVGGRLLQIPRFRSTLDTSSSPLSFVEVDLDEIDQDYHYKVHSPNKVADKAQVDDFLGHLFDDFDPDMSKPLWQLHYFPKVEGGKSCLIANMSHIIGDGIAMVEVLRKILDPEESGARKTLSQPARRERPKRFGFWKKLKIFAAGLWEGITAVASIPDKPNTLRLVDTNVTSATKRCVFTESIPLEKVKMVKNLYKGATLNDVMMTMLNLTLRAYFQTVDDKDALQNEIRAQFPINMRSAEQVDPFRDGDSCNCFSMGTMKLFANEPGDPSQVFFKTKTLLDEIKHSPAPLVGWYAAWAGIRILFRSLVNKLILGAGAKATAMLSNVPGPQEVVHIGGYELDDLRFLAFTPVGFYVGLLTYNGSLSASFCVDSELADPSLVAKHWVPQFESFLKHATKKAAANGGKIPAPLL